MNQPALISNYHHGNYSLSTSGFFPRPHQARFNPDNLQPPSRVNNEEYWCETCDRCFKTWKILENHKQQHQKCNIDGCQFVAHPKVITKHIQMQHSTGIYKKIAKLNNPEEVQKWLDERKRKYPTKENIQKKAAEIKEKVERGEKMGLKRQHRGFKSDQQNKRLMQDKNKSNKRFIKDENINFKHKIKSKVNSNIKPNNFYRIPSPVSSRKLRPFSGIVDLIVQPTVEEEEKPKSHFLIDDDDDYTELEKVPVQSEEPKICNVLSSLICNYGSSDEEEDSIQDCSSKTKSMQHVSLNTNKLEKVANGDSKIISKNHRDTQRLKEVVNSDTEVILENHRNQQSDDDSGPEEQIITKIDLNENKSRNQTFNVSNKLHGANKNTVKENNEKIISKVIYTKPKFKKPPSTLLRKLLWKEMRQERNMVLQCIRYIVKNKYFDQNIT